MKKRTGITLIVAFVLIFAGGLTFALGMNKLNWDFRELSMSKYTTNAYEINSDYENISLNSKNAIIKIVPSLDEKTTISCFDQEHITYSTSVIDNTLNLDFVDGRKWYNKIFDFKLPRITISLPSGEYGNLSINSRTSDVIISNDFTFNNLNINLSTGDVNTSATLKGIAKITTSTGDIKINNITATDLDLSVTTGDISIKNTTCTGEIKVFVDTGECELENVKCKSLFSTGDTGDIELDNFIASEKISIQRDTGDVSFSRVDAAELYIKTSTGDVEGSILTDKIFAVKSSSGHVRVPSSTTGGICEVSTSTGDIKLWIYQ